MIICPHEKITVYKNKKNNRIAARCRACKIQGSYASSKPEAINNLRATPQFFL